VAETAWPDGSFGRARGSDPRPWRPKACQLCAKEPGALAGGDGWLYVHGVPRRPRLQIAGGLYHVHGRGNRKQVIYTSDSERRFFLALLWETAAELGWRIHAYCLMTNHYHLLLETAEPNLSDGMQRLQSLYAQRFNRLHDLTGHLFGGRFGSVLVDGNVQLVVVARYIVLNPVRAGLCATAADWPWSSYRATIAAGKPRHLYRDLILAQFASRASDGARRFAEFVAEAERIVRAARPPPP